MPLEPENVDQGEPDQDKLEHENADHGEPDQDQLGQDEPNQGELNQGKFPTTQENEGQVKRSSRNRRSSTKYPSSQYILLTDDGVPETYEEARAHNTMIN